jgi:hypothetical protein
LTDKYIVEHFGGLTMQQKIGVRTIFLFLGFILAVSGCATNKNQVAYADFDFTAKTVPEGILLTFFNLPSTTELLQISVTDKNSNAYPEMNYAKGQFARADIKGSSLELVKKTGKVFFPFVHAGHVYEIYASFSYDIINGDMVQSRGNWIDADFVAGNGNYYDNYLELILNEFQTSITLSSEPVFPAEMRYDPNNYRFAVIIKENETSTLFYPGAKDDGGKHWEFVPELNNQLKERRWLQSGDYPTFITAYCNIIYDNISWNVEIAKSPVFVYSYR